MSVEVNADDTGVIFILSLVYVAFSFEYDEGRFLRRGCCVPIEHSTVKARQEARTPILPLGSSPNAEGLQINHHNGWLLQKSAAKMRQHVIIARLVKTDPAIRAHVLSGCSAEIKGWCTHVYPQRSYDGR